MYKPRLVTERKSIDFIKACIIPTIIKSGDSCLKNINLIFIKVNGTVVSVEVSLHINQWDHWLRQIGWVTVLLHCSETVQWFMCLWETEWSIVELASDLWLLCAPIDQICHVSQYKYLKILQNKVHIKRQNKIIWYY